MALYVEGPGAQVWRPATKTITFTGASGLGLHGTTATIFTIAGGLVVIREIVGRCTTTVTGASGTLKLGTASQPTVFIGSTTGTGLTTVANVWATTTPTAGAIALAAADKEIATVESIIITFDVTNDTTAGVLEIDCLWAPLTPGATLS